MSGSQIIQLADVPKRSIADTRESGSRPVARTKLDPADALSAIDTWQLGETTREFKVRRTALGSVATLYQAGSPVSCGYGKGCAAALADALDRYWEKVRVAK